MWSLVRLFLSLPHFHLFNLQQSFRETYRKVVLRNMSK